MPDLTPRIGIKKPLGNENVSRASFNENWDIIDAKVATLGSDGKVPSDQLNVQEAVAGGASGLMTGTQLAKLNGIAPGAEVNQNAFSQVNVNGALVTADFKSDQLNVFPGTGISVSADSPNNKMTIALETPTPVNLSLQNGTTVFSDRTPRYIRDGYAVEFDGAVIATGAGVTIATLPVVTPSVRPPKTQIFKVAHNYSTSNDGATIYVNPDGTVILQVAADYSKAISLCGIRFYTI